MIGRILRQFSIDTGIGQKEVAQALHFSTQRVNNYYRDMAEPPDEFYKLFRKNFQIDLKSLMEKEKREGSTKINHMKPIPVFDFDFIPFGEVDFTKNNEAIKYFVDAPIMADATAIVKVIGEAMSPEITPSDFVSIREIKDKKTIPFGLPYLIITKEQRLFRYIKSEEGKSMRLTAANINFGDMLINKEDAILIFQITMKMTRIS
jgi:transcriptional regulator with XRE-family HTH domain